MITRLDMKKQVFKFTWHLPKHAKYEKVFAKKMSFSFLFY